MRPTSRTLAIFAGLSGILILYIWNVYWVRPANLFGLWHDDTIYFSSAKAIAQGHGYILPSVPGNPPATKYPILYPWLLSWVWRISPEFPGNISLAILLNLLFGAAATFLVYGYLRTTFDLKAGESLLITSFFILHPFTILYSSAIVSEIPFAAFSIATLWSGEAALRRPGRTNLIIISAILGDLCVFMRSAGIALCAGIIAALLLRKLWRHALLFSSATVPALCYFAYKTWFQVATLPPVAFSGQLPGWKQTWLYYTSYTAFRKIDSPSFGIAVTLLVNQCLYLIFTLPNYLFAPWSGSHIVVWFVMALFLATVIFSGMRRAVAHHKGILTGLAFAVYIGLLMAWDYPDWVRFLLPFFPFILALLWIECRSWNSWIQRAFRGIQVRDKILAFGFLTCALTFTGVIIWNYCGPGRVWEQGLSAERRGRLEEKLEAYDWIRLHTARDSRIIAVADVLSYLYTDRQAMNFTVLMPAGVYDKRRLSLDLAHIADVPRAIGASYWMVTNEDALSQLKALREPLATRLAEMEGRLPKVFESSRGGVKIYDLTCLHRTDDPACLSINKVMLPSGATEATVGTSDR
jgi:hypothetical protein